jgi:hypothetical protein
MSFLCILFILHALLILAKDRETSGDGKSAGGESSFQEFTSGVVRHGCTSNGANDTASVVERRSRFGQRRLEV